VKDWLSAMRCLVCNTEMVLMEAVSADATMLPGFEHHTFLCSHCHDIERRLVFTGAKRPTRLLPTTKLQMGRGTAPKTSAWIRAVEKLVSRQKALKEEQTLAKKGSGQASAVEKPRSSERTAVKERPLTAGTTDIIGEFNRVWDDPRPAADKPIGPPGTPKAE
jgi:hypothetical protein